METFLQDERKEAAASGKDKDKDIPLSQHPYVKKLENKLTVEDMLVFPDRFDNIKEEKAYFVKEMLEHESSKEFKPTHKLRPEAGILEKELDIYTRKVAWSSQPQLRVSMTFDGEVSVRGAGALSLSLSLSLSQLAYISGLALLTA